MATIATGPAGSSRAPRQPWPAQRRAPEARAERAWRGGGMGAVLWGVQRYERAARERADIGDREPRRAPPRGRVRRRRRAPSGTTRRRRRRLQPDPEAVVGAPGGSTSTTIAPPGASSSPRGAAAGPDAPPMPMLPSRSSTVPQAPAAGTRRRRAGDRAAAAAPGEQDGDGGEVDAQPAMPRPAAPPEAAGSAADVEHRPLDAREDRLLGGVAAASQRSIGSGSKPPVGEPQRRARPGAVRRGASRRP